MLQVTGAHTKISTSIRWEIPGLALVKMIWEFVNPLLNIVQQCDAPIKKTDAILDALALYRVHITQVILLHCSAPTQNPFVYCLQFWAPQSKRIVTDCNIYQEGLGNQALWSS